MRFQIQKLTKYKNIFNLVYIINQQKILFFCKYFFSKPIANTICNPQLLSTSLQHNQQQTSNSVHLLHQFITRSTQTLNLTYSQKKQTILFIIHKNIQHQNTWFNLQQLLEIIIKQNTLIIELQSKNTFGSQLSDKIQKFLKSNKNYNTKLNNNQIKIHVIGKSNKVYIMINEKSITEKFQNLCKQLEKVKEDKQNYMNQETNLISFQIKSKNSFGQIRKLLDNQGAMRAFFDSLLISIKFNKTKLVEQVILKFFQSIQQQSIRKVLKTFNNLNLQLKFQSSQIFDFYQKLKVFAKIQNKIETYFFSAIKGQYKDNAKIYYFNKVFSLIGKVQGEGIQSLIDGSFTEGGQEE